MKTSIRTKEATMKTIPLPVTLVTSADKDGKNNIITITYVTGVNEEPPMMGVAIRPEKYSNKLIRETKEFVINVPTLSLIKEIDFCGTYSGRDVDKFSELGLTPLKSEKIKTPMIKECPINIECKVEKTIKLPSHDFFIGKVVQLHIDEDLFNQEGNVPDFEKLEFLFTTFLDYRVIGKKVGEAFKESKKLKIE